MGYWPSVRSRWLDICQALFVFSLCVYGSIRCRSPLTLKKRQHEVNIQSYHIADSVSGHDKPNPALWLALPSERAKWRYFSRSGPPAVFRKKNFPESHIISPLVNKVVRSRWLISLPLFFSTLSRSILICKIKNEANNQPDWPHAWSITQRRAWFIKDLSHGERTLFWGGGTPYNGLYGEAPPERGTFFRLQVYKRVGISQV